MSKKESRDTLFHGTIENLNVGDVVKPRFKGGVAWASPDVEAVIEHTKDRTRTGLGIRSERYHPVHHGNIYEVEPLTANDPTLSTDNSSGTRGAVNSSRGFRVTRQFASVLGDPSHLRDLQEDHPNFDPNKESYVK